MARLCESFFSGNLSFAEKGITKRKNNENLRTECDLFLEELNDCSLNEIITYVTQKDHFIINSTNIPQFSSFKHGTIEAISRLRKAGDYGPTFKEFGEQLLGQGKKAGAYVKYGENHAKLSNLFDLTYIVKNGTSRIYLSELGQKVEQIDYENNELILAKLALRIPIIQYYFKEESLHIDNLVYFLSKYLSQSTALRRKSNVLYIINLIKAYL